MMGWMYHFGFAVLDFYIGGKYDVIDSWNCALQGNKHWDARLHFLLVGRIVKFHNS